METKYLTCINCPLGCALTVELQGAQILAIKGNTCKRGAVYARKEVTAPVRMVTSTVKVTDGVLPVVSVKTREAIPKEKIFACVRELKQICLKAPVEMGAVVLSDAAGTGVDVVTTKEIKGRENPSCFHEEAERKRS